MKTRLISWLASGMIISTFMFPSMAKADSNSTAFFPPALEGIELTSSQQEQFQAVREQTKSQIKTLLNAEQQATLKDALAQGNDMRSAMKSLDLSFKQRREMKNIMQTMRSEVESILTPEQKDQIQDRMQNSQK